MAEEIGRTKQKKVKLMGDGMQTFTARWLFPVDTPPLERGTITLQADRIVAVDPHGARTPNVDLGNVAILPGFVNAHTHLDLTGALGKCLPTPDFTQWLRKVIAFRRNQLSWDQRQREIAAGLKQCQQFGATLIGDVSAGGSSWPAFLDAPCRGVVFYELLGLTDERAEQSWHSFQSWHDVIPTRYAKETLRLGLSPHAPYSVGQALHERIASRSFPVATHLAETPAELELLGSLSGPFVDFLKELNVWDPDSLVADANDVIKRYPHGIFVHGNYLDPATPFLPTQSLVVCPRTHSAFGHLHHPFPKMSVRVALGTDSLASNPDLDILTEARFLRRHYPEVAAASILRMLTLNGAEALGFDSITGSLTPGKSAELVVLPLPNVEGRDPHDLVLDSDLAVERVMFRGEWRDATIES